MRKCGEEVPGFMLHSMFFELEKERVTDGVE
jgi:hypothetical protein